MYQLVLEYRQHTEGLSLIGQKLSSHSVLFTVWQTFGLTPSQYAITHGQVLTIVQSYTEFNLIVIHYSCEPCNIYILMRINNSSQDYQLYIDLIHLNTEFLSTELHTWNAKENAIIKRQRIFFVLRFQLSISEHSVNRNSFDSIDSGCLVYTLQALKPTLGMDFAALSILTVSNAVCTACYRSVELHNCSITEINYAENSHFLHFSYQKVWGVTCQTEDWKTWALWLTTTQNVDIHTCTNMFWHHWSSSKQHLEISTLTVFLIAKIPTYSFLVALVLDIPPTLAFLYSVLSFRNSTAKILNKNLYTHCIGIYVHW